MEMLGTFAAIEFKWFKETIRLLNFLEALPIHSAFESKVERPGR